MKRCPFCAEEIQEAAIKCRFCGSDVRVAPGSAPAHGSQQNAPGGAAPTPSPGQHGGAGPFHQHGAGEPAHPVTAVNIFTGAPSWRAQFWPHVGAALLAVAGVAAIIALPMTVSGMAFTTALAIGGALTVGGAGWFGFLYLKRISVRYNLNTRTIDVEMGIFSKTIETMQLWKVRDVEFYQSLLDRLLNIAHIRVFTHDVTTPQLLMWGIPESREIFDRLKNSIEIARQSRNVIGVVE